MAVFLVVSAAASIAGGWGWLGAAFAAAFLMLLIRDVQFYDPRSRVLVQSTALAGLELGRRVIKKGNALDIPLKPVRPLQFPLSVAILGDAPRVSAEDDKRAVCVFRAALVGLLMKGLIEMHPVVYYGRRAGQTVYANKTEHRVVARPVAISGDRLGALEERILRALIDQARRLSDVDGWLDGPRVCELVWSSFESDVSDPYDSLLSLAEQNATALGLCRIETKGFWNPTRLVTWDGPCIQELRTDCSTASDLMQQFKSSDPATWDSLFKQISDGVKSRIETGDGFVIASAAQTTRAWSVTSTPFLLLV